MGGEWVKMGAEVNVPSLCKTRQHVSASDPVLKASTFQRYLLPNHDSLHHQLGMATVIDVDPSGDVLLACRPGCEEVQR